MKQPLRYMPLLLLVSVLWLPPVYTQGIHFSQYDRTPLQVNPAMVGNTKGNVRLLTGYTNQWAQVLSSDAYVAHYLSVDARVLDDGKQAMGLGISGWNNKIGGNKLGSKSLNLSANYQRKIGNAKKVEHRLLLGVEAGILNRKINDNIFSGVAVDYSKLDVNIGFVWQSTFKNGNALFLGVAGHHINGSRVIVLSIEQVVTRLTRYTLHGGGEVGLSDSWSVIPSFLYLAQGTDNELTLGGSLRKSFGEEGSNKFFQIGVLTRMLQSNKIIPSVVLNLKRFSVGLSTDISISSGLRQAGDFRGAGELTVGYLIAAVSSNNKRPIQ